MQIEVSGRSAYLYTGGKQPGKVTDEHNGTVVFIHGAQQDHSCWTLQARWFAHHGFQVLAPDLPGHGRSEGEALSSVEVTTLCVGFSTASAALLSGTFEADAPNGTVKPRRIVSISPLAP